jgi:hypothetical protein
VVIIHTLSTAARYSTHIFRKIFSAQKDGEQLDVIEPAISRFCNGESTTRAD